MMQEMRKKRTRGTDIEKCDLCTQVNRREERQKKGNEEARVCSIISRVACEVRQA